jgi:hypothetical protein
MARIPLDQSRGTANPASNRMKPLLCGALAFRPPGLQASVRHPRGQRNRIVLGLISLLFLSLCTSGCINTEVRHAATAEGPTVTEFEYQMILDNVAMYVDFGGHPPTGAAASTWTPSDTQVGDYPIPWHLKFTSLAIAGNRAISTQFGYQWQQNLQQTTGNTATTSATGIQNAANMAGQFQNNIQRALLGTPSASETRTWTLIPSIDGKELSGLRDVYVTWIYGTNAVKIVSTPDHAPRAALPLDPQEASKADWLTTPRASSDDPIVYSSHYGKTTVAVTKSHMGDFNRLFFALMSAAPKTGAEILNAALR